MKRCPVCNSKKGVREYLYGFPMEQPDPAKYIIGGCCISENMPDFKCVICFTDFYKDKDAYHNRFIDDGSGITFECKACKMQVFALESITSHQCSESANPWEGY